MADRHEIEPAHILRAVLSDHAARRVLEVCGASPTEVRITLDRLGLDAMEALDPEVVHALGVEVDQLLRELGPGPARDERWRDRTVSPAAREVLLGALGEAARLGTPVTGWHLLVGLVASSDPVVVATFAEHRLRLRDVRRVGRRLGRRAGDR
jgi:hypothetical protein